MKQQNTEYRIQNTECLPAVRRLPDQESAFYILYSCLSGRGACSAREGAELAGAGMVILESFLEVALLKIRP